MSSTSEKSITTIMTEDPSTIERAKPISVAYGMLQDAPFHHVVVTEDDAPIGMISTSDILRLVYDVDGTDDQALRTYIDHQFTIDDAMSDDLKTLGTGATIQDAAAMLSDGSFHSIVVLDEADKLVGIVTTTDLARFIADS